MKKFFILMVCCLMLMACGKVDTPDMDEEETNKVEDKEEILSVSMLAVGDNLIHSSIYESHERADGTYNFDDLYSQTKKYTENVDIAYIDQETICAGEELGYSNYPCFNGPYEILDAVVNAGFDWISTSSNHTFDRGVQGVLNQLEHLEQYEDVYVTGSHKSKEDAETLQVIEKNGLKIGILGYTYGLNGFILPEGQEYLVDLIDKDKIASDMERLKKVSDVQVVSMHWGTENSFVVNDEQIDLAQFLSDLGTDVIIGCHPHVIQPMDYVTGKDGNETLVIYSMGNFMSAQDANDNMLGLMPMWTINFNTKTKEVTLSDVKVYPTITYIGGIEMDAKTNMKVYESYALKDYTNELAKTHFITIWRENQPVTREYYIDLVHQVMNDKVEIIY